MQASAMVAGKNYAWSDAAHLPQPPLTKVRFVGPTKTGQARVRWMDGDLRGLEEWVPTRRILCSWSGRKDYLKYRAQKAELELEARSLDPVVQEAISHVLVASGEETGFRRMYSTSTEVIERLWHRAQLPGSPFDEPGTFSNETGIMMGWRATLKLAKAFAAAEPEPCVQLVDEYERELRAEGHEPGRSFMHEYLREEQPSYALVRQWAGWDNTQGVLEKELARLHQLLSMAEYWLRDAGDDVHAHQLRRARNGQ